jgi:hypothetical protein
MAPIMRVVLVLRVVLVRELLRSLREPGGIRPRPAAVRPGRTPGKGGGMDTSTWLGEFAADDLSPLERSMALAAMRDRKDDLDAEREQADKDAAAGERREALMLANHQAGDPLGQMSLARARFAEYDDRCRDLADQLRRAEAKRDRAAESVEFFARRAQEARDMVSRSAPADPAAAAVQRAREVHREFARNTRAALSEAVTGRRPKGGRGGFAVRNEPVTCKACIAVGASPWESWEIHHSDADGNPVSAPSGTPVPAPVPDNGEQEAGRLMDLGYSREIAELSQRVITR